jgi:hypothetical protein
VEYLSVQEYEFEGELDVSVVWNQEGINAKKNLVTDQNAEELDAVFEPGKEFGFDATLELEEAKEAEPKSEEADSEVLAA